MSAPQLSPRLQAVADYVPAQARLADIGSDHAYLPAYLLEKGQIDWALAGEVAQGPLNNVKREIAALGLDGRLVPRLADGLAAITPKDQVDTVVVAGMGGLLISQILAGPAKPLDYQHLILQPNTDEAQVRLWLSTNGYQVTAEQIVQEGRHFYEIISATPGSQQLNEQELTFGPFLMQQQSSVFKAKWLHRLTQIERIVAQLKTAGRLNDPVYQERLQEKKAILEVLDSGKCTEPN